MNVAIQPCNREQYAVVLNGNPTTSKFEMCTISEMDEDGRDGLHYVASLMIHRLACRHIIPMCEVDYYIDALKEAIEQERGFMTGHVVGWK